MKVLCVDDDPVMRLMLVETFRLAGHEVIVARNGVEALALLYDAAFDVVLMDLEMPEMDGNETIEAMRQAGIETPVIALTANAADLEGRVSAVVSKPPHCQLLIALAEGLAEKTKAARAKLTEAPT